MLLFTKFNSIKKLSCQIWWQFHSFLARHPAPLVWKGLPLGMILYAAVIVDQDGVVHHMDQTRFLQVLLGPVDLLKAPGDLLQLGQTLLRHGVLPCSLVTPEVRRPHRQSECVDVS